jgi:predicted dehydrogenase
MEPVRWGVLGVSSHYQLRVSTSLRESSQIELVGIASRDRSRADEAAKQLGFARGYGGYEDLLDDPSIEAVYIPLPNHLHLEWIKRAADKGKHILCEKPLGLDASEVQEAIAYTSSKGVLLMEAFMYRFHPQWLRAREIVRIGEIGTPTAVHCNFFYNNQDPGNIRNQKKAGGGALMDIGCYAVSSARFLLDAEPRRVIGVIDQDDRFETDRLTSGILDFGGVHSVFSVGTQTESAQAVEVFGTGGSVRVVLPFNAYPDVPMELEIRTGIGERIYASDPVDQYQQQFEAFSDAIRSGESVPTPIEDALQNQKILDALFQSADSDRWVEV